MKAENLRRLLHEWRDGKSDPSGDPLVVMPLPSDDCLEDHTAAIDLRLGSWFLSPTLSRITCLRVGREDEPITKTHFVPFGKDYILHPRSFVLGVTLEWIRMPLRMAGYVNGKSSWGRRGLIIATAAVVHPGFIGCLTLELTNLGEVPIAIRPGMRIGQLSFHELSGSTDASSLSKPLLNFSGQRRPVLGTVQ